MWCCWACATGDPCTGTRRYRRSEARVRLHAVWRAWESLRLDPAIGIARWLWDVADPQMDRLRNPDQGPFVACGEGDDEQHLGWLPTSEVKRASARSGSGHCP